MSKDLYMINFFRYSRGYIRANIMSDKFLLVVHAPNDTRSRMKSRESVKKFYKVLKDRCVTIVTGLVF